MMGVLSSEALANFSRNKAGYLRKFRVEHPRVYYFHQAADPHSHLVIQKLAALKAQYALDFVVHLVDPPEAVFKGDVTRFDHWTRDDAAAIASYFDVHFEPLHIPTEAEVSVANGLLSQGITDPGFADRGVEIGEQLWSGKLNNQTPVNSGAQRNKGNQLRKRLGHYLGGTFYFEGEWFWGVDRLHLLERRLQREGFGQGDLVCPLPEQAQFTQTKADSSIVLEYFPSLRSPYTAIGHRRLLQIVESTGVTLKLRPVMPMMMRGVPAPLVKQRYIMSDSGREARYYNEPFGPFCDPFGEPVKWAFAAFHCADQQGLGLTFVTEYLAASFAEGLNIREQAGLAEVCRRAGFDLAQVDPGADWQSALEENVALMASGSLWGVPSFRVSGGHAVDGSMNDKVYSCWGQDRIWRVAAEIESRSIEAGR
tara:strand:+ start:3133 stop:4404 length:1272 start_codon:yes stop_codon:yes gene_type:complete